MGGWKRLWFVLKAGQLEQWPTERTSGGKPAQVIELPNDGSVVASEVAESQFKKSNVLLLQLPKRRYYFEAATSGERGDWIHSIWNRRMLSQGNSEPVGSPLSLAALEGLAAPLFPPRPDVRRLATDEAVAPLPSGPGSPVVASPQKGTPATQANLNSSYYDMPTPGSRRPASTPQPPTIASPPATPGYPPADALPETPLPKYNPDGVEPTQDKLLAVQREGINLDEALRESDWDERFQAVMAEQPQTLEESLDKGRAMTGVVGKFVAASRKFAAQIVDEYHLPHEQKTIPLYRPDETLDPAQLTERDELFFHNGILFRFAADMEGETEVLGSDNVAMKVAGHEVKGINAYLQCNLPRLHVSLMTLVDYKGFRLICIAYVLLDENALTWIVRSGFTQLDPEVDQLLQEASHRLFLKPHVVFPDQTRPMTVPCSMEVAGYRIHDRIYVMNLSRVFPSDNPVRNTSQILTHFLRSELLRSYGRPLSSDAFCNVGGIAPDMQDNDAEVISACRYLQDIVIPSFVQKLDMLELFPVDSEGLATEMHRAGINTRYLGRIARLTKLPHVRELCTVDMVGRVCKILLGRNLRSMLRQQKHLHRTAGELFADNFDFEPLGVDGMDRMVRECIVDFFNLVLGANDESERFWQTVLVPEVEVKFGFQVNPRLVRRQHLFLNLQYQTGAKFIDDDLYDFNAPQGPVHLNHMVTIGARVKFPLNDALECFEVSRKATMFRNQGNLELAILALNIQLELHRNLHGLNTIEAARILTALAACYVRQVNAGHSILCANAALGVSRRFHAEAARVYNVLAEAYFLRNEQLRVNECHQLALGAASFHLGPSHPLLLEVFQTLGKLHQRLEENGDALRMFEQCRSLAEKVLGNNHPTTAFFYNRVGHVYRSLNDLGRATAAFEKAVLIYRTVLGPNDLTTALSYFYMAEVLTQRGQFDRAKEFAMQALLVREQQLGPNDPATLNSYYQVAVVHERKGDPVEAVEKFERVLGTLKESDDEDSMNMIQDITQRIIQIKFNELTPERALILGKIRAQDRGMNDSTTLNSVIVELFEAASPSAYVDALFTRVAAMDEEAYVKLACITQLVEDQAIRLRVDAALAEALDAEEEGNDDTASVLTSVADPAPIKRGRFGRR